MADKPEQKQEQQKAEAKAKSEHKPEHRPAHKEIDLKYLVRILNTDMDGSKCIGHQLTKIKGVGYQYANMVCRVAGIDAMKKTSNLSQQEIERVEDIIINPLKYNVPSWLLNRRKDPEDGTNKHLLNVDLTFVRDNDIKMMKKIRTFKGIRHMYGLPVRGQKMRSKFRKNKGKVMGVKRSAGAKAAGSGKT